MEYVLIGLVAIALALIVIIWRAVDAEDRCPDCGTHKDWWDARKWTCPGCGAHN